MPIVKYLSGFALTLTVAGCVVAPPPRRVVYEAPPPPPGPQPEAVYVQVAPPEPIVEVQPPPPGPPELYFWQAGHWRWNGRSHYWTAGHWARRPEHFVGWEAPHWEHRPGGWLFIEGHFR